LNKKISCPSVDLGVDGKEMSPASLGNEGSIIKPWDPCFTDSTTTAMFKIFFQIIQRNLPSLNVEEQ